MHPATRLPLALLPPLLVAAAACSSSEPAAEALPPPSRAGWEPAGPFPGFTLVGSLRSRRAHLVDMSGTSVHSWVSEGEPVSMYLTERGTLLRTLQGGDDHPRFRGGGSSGFLEELDWDGTRIWTFEWDSEESHLHHDVEEMPNGNVLFIAWDRHTREEALAVGRDPELLRGEELWPDAIYEVRPTRPEGGEIVWSWHSWDHLVQEFDPEAPNYADPAAHPERIDVNGDRDVEPPDEDAQDARQRRMAALGYGGGTTDDDDDDADHDGGADGDDANGDGDGEDEDEDVDPAEKAIRDRIRDADWMHSNGVDYNAELDQIAISVRRYDEIWIVDHSTTREEAAGSTGGRYGKGGDLLYRWGNRFAYGMGEWADRRLLGQHNVQWIPEGHLGAGNLIVYDNGTDDDRAWSTIDEWWAPRDAEGNYLRAEGEPFGPDETEWTYEAEEPTDFYSSFISGVQRLPNGNTLICAGAPGRVFEVDVEGTVVWDWRNPYGLDPEVDEVDGDDDGSPVNPTSLFRAERYAPDHPGIVALREKGAPIPVDPGTGPATNQLEVPEEEGEDVEGDGADDGAGR